MQVKELMTETVISIDVRQTLQQAAGRMLHYDVGSIIVTNGESPVGILTQSDVLEAGVVTDESLSQLSISNVMSNPVVTVQPTATVREAVELMQDHAVKHLPVATEVDLHGIITSSDVVYHHEELLSEVEALQQEPTERLAVETYDGSNEMRRGVE